MSFLRNIAVGAAFAVAASTATATAQSDEAGLNKDYRTFNAGGEIAYGQISDSQGVNVEFGEV